MFDSTTDLTRLAMAEQDVMGLNPQQRIDRMLDLRNESFALLDTAIQHFVTDQNKELAATAVLYSGGNDSTVLAHLFRNRADFAIHANTTIGIEQTRQFVRDTCRSWGLELREYYPPPGSTYEELVVAHGFPGPGHHYKMYQRLKERCLMQARRQVIPRSESRKKRIVFLAGRRRTESARRASVPEFERTGSIVWVSPLVNWTKTDLNTYREWAGDVPRNEVSDLIHMSGECLCGAFAHKDELNEIEMFFPDVAAGIRELEAKVRDAGHPEKVCQWGWGANKKLSAKDMKAGPLCSSCVYRADEEHDHE